FERDEWKIRLKNGLKRIEEYIFASQQEQIKQFTDIKAKVVSAIKDNQTTFKHGFICFASADQIFMKHVQVPIKTRFYWEDQPVTKPLEHLRSKYPKSGVVLLQSEKVAILDTLLGELKGEVHYTFDLQNEHWKQYKGLAFGAIISSSANHRDKYSHRLKQNKARWLKSLIPKIEKHAKDGEWEGIYLVGPAELTKDIQPHLNTRILGILSRNFSGKT